MQQMYCVCVMQHCFACQHFIYRYRLKNIQQNYFCCSMSLNQIVLEGGVHLRHTVLDTKHKSALDQFISRHQKPYRSCVNI